MHALGPERGAATSARCTRPPSVVGRCRHSAAGPPISLLQQNSSGSIQCLGTRYDASGQESSAGSSEAGAGEQEVILAKAKRRVATLRAVRVSQLEAVAAAAASSADAAQPNRAAPLRQAVSEQKEDRSDSSRERDAVRGGAESRSIGSSVSPKERNDVKEMWRRSEGASEKGGDAASASFGVSTGNHADSHGVRAAQRKKTAAAAALDGDEQPPFPPKNPETRRRVLQGDEGDDPSAFDHVAASRAAMAARLSEAARYAAHLEAEVAVCAADASGAADQLAQICEELAPVVRQAGLAAGGASGAQGCDSCRTLQPHLLAQQLARMQQSASVRVQRLRGSALREVPVVWEGVASEVRLMGSFDGWSRGVRLSCQGGDSVFRRFEGTLKARQGDHLVKFQVDRRWRLAAGWPTCEDASGTSNNVLHIHP